MASAGRPPPPFVDVTQFQGLYTKSNPEVLDPSQQRVLQNADLFRIYGAASKVRGNTRILASKYTENTIVQPISWIDFYKHP